MVLTVSSDFTLNDEQKSYMEGALLGDGCLALAKRAKNVYFSYLSSSLQHVEFIHSKFKEFCTDNYKTIKKRIIFDKRTNKFYTNYSFRTKSLPVFTEIYNIWYPNNIKKIPENLKINPIILLVWYIGDGELESKQGVIKLHTNSFLKSDIEKICEKIGYNSVCTYKEKEQYIIRIPRKSVKLFLETIGDCPFNDYQHKWKQVDYKNKNIEQNGTKKTIEKIDDLLKSWHTGLFTINELSKIYNLEYNSIVHWFKKLNISYNKISLCKEITQKDTNGVIIKIWKSAMEIEKTLGYDNSVICKIIKSGKIYKKYYWGFLSNNKKITNFVTND